MEAWLAKSRFTALVYLHEDRHHGLTIKVDDIRLRQAKDYCGSHPGRCSTHLYQLPTAPPRHTRTRLLEGGDWVGFANGLNELLDYLNVAADVWTYCPRDRRQYGQRYYLRKGSSRRVRHREHYSSEWDRHIYAEDFIDCCAQAPPVTIYPDGTPGLAAWQRELVPC